MKVRLVQQIQSLFSWLFPSCPNQGVQNGTQDKLRIYFLSRNLSPHVLVSLQKVLERLEDEKRAFLEKAGSAGEAFAVRHIDPELSLLREFLGSSQGSDYTIRAQRRPGTFDLSPLVHDENYVFHRIKENAERYACQAVLSDIAFLRTYPMEVVTQSAPSEHAKVLHKIKKPLQDIEKKTEQLLAQKPSEADFFELFRWRESLDKERQILHDSVLKCVEEHIAPFKFKYSTEKGVYHWLGQELHSLSFEQLHALFHDLFEAVKSSELMRSDSLFLAFFERAKQRFHAVFCRSDDYSEEERMRVLQTVRLIEDFMGSGEEGE